MIGLKVKLNACERGLVLFHPHPTVGEDSRGGSGRDVQSNKSPSRRPENKSSGRGVGREARSNGLLLRPTPRKQVSFAPPRQRKQEWRQGGGRVTFAPGDANKNGDKGACRDAQSNE